MGVAERSDYSEGWGAWQCRVRNCPKQTFSLPLPIALQTVLSYHKSAY
jgi:hypothetical protein